MLIIAKFNKIYTMFFRFFHSYKVGIRPKVQGGTIHKYLKRCLYILIAKDGMWGFVLGFFLQLVSLTSCLKCSYCTQVCSQIYH